MDLINAGLDDQFVKNILFAWELGANWGHIANSVFLGEELRLAGYRVVFAVRDPVAAKEILLPLGFPFVHAPLPNYEKKIPQPSSYSEMLVGLGYTNDEALSKMIEAWGDIFNIVNPSLVVIEHAPTALLAARIKNLKVIQLGSGFTIPPSISPFPSIRPWLKISFEELQLAEATVLKSINALLHRHNADECDRLCTLFDETPQVLTTLPELDHYSPVYRANSHTYVGCFPSLPGKLNVEWEHVGAKNIFAYLRSSHPAFIAVLETLRALNFKAVCVAPDVSDEVLKKFSSSQLRIFSKPVDVEFLLKNADLCINYGGAGVLAQAALAGIPQLILPITVEQYLSGLRVENLGVGRIETEWIVSPLGRAVIQITENSEFKRKAENFANKYISFNSRAALKQVVSIFEYQLR